jgi:hypothetical protein
MKNFIRLSCALMLGMLSIASCKKDTRELNQNLRPVSKLNLPEDQVALTLQPATTSSVEFKWAAATAEGGNHLLYELAFDREDGDFSKPIYKTVSQGGGVETSVTLSHKELNKIANMGGIAASSTGRLKWTILASIGTSVVPGSVSRSIQISRPAGFAELPSEMYITGSATEGGEDVEKAVKLKKNEDGVFEIYTSLKNGGYILTDQPAAGGKKYYVDNGLIKEGDVPFKVNEDKNYRLTYDFNVATANMVEIQSVGLWMSAYNAEIGQLTYQGNSTWSGASIPIEFFQFSWGKDERYKFVMHTSAGLQFMGSPRTDNGTPAGQEASYFFLVPVSNDQWANTYKFDPAADRKNVKVDLLFKTDAPYTHVITVK